MTRGTLTAVVAVLLAGWSYGEGPDVSGDTGQLKKAADFAPPEQIVSVRDPAAYRRATGILTQAEHQAVQVDMAALYERRRRMYEGETFVESLFCVPRQPFQPHLAGLPSTSGSKADDAPWMVWWVLAAGVPVGALILFSLWWRWQMAQERAARAGILRINHRRYIRAINAQRMQGPHS